MSTLSHLALHAPRPCSAEAKSATLQDPSELQGMGTAVNVQASPGQAVTQWKKLQAAHENMSMHMQHASTDPGTDGMSGSGAE